MSQAYPEITINGNVGSKECNVSRLKAG